MKSIKTSPHIPTKIEVKEIGVNRVQITAYPFENGYAITLAHPLRRLLLGSSVGFAPVALRIAGVAHEFDSVRGVTEDVSQFIVNLKTIRFKIKDGSDSISVDYAFNGPKVITGADLSNDLVEVVTPDVHLATINKDATLSFSIVIPIAMLCPPNCLMYVLHFSNASCKSNPGILLPEPRAKSSS